MPMNFSAPRNTNGSKIAKSRIDAGITQAKLAESRGTKKGTVSKWESGTIPRKKNLEKMAKVFGCKMCDLI